MCKLSNFLASRSRLCTGTCVNSDRLQVRPLHRQPHQRLPPPPPTPKTPPFPLKITALPPRSPPSPSPRTAHGFAVRAVSVEVADAFHVSVAHGAVPAHPPAELSGGCRMSEVQLCWDVALRYMSLAEGEELGFGFERVEVSWPLDSGIRRLDHVAGNVTSLEEAVEYVKGFTGFHGFVEFTAEYVGTAESGFNSVAVANNHEMVLLPINEPVFGTKRRSQIQTFLEHNEGPGLQHLALVSEDIFRTLREMRQRSWVGAFEFMPSPPPTYYTNLKNRAGDVLTDEQIKECEELGILADRDVQGVMLQVFTKPVGDRPTIFIEIIQRIGCMVKDEEGKTNQKGGCGGFGKGNYSELFRSIEEYEKTLEAKTKVDAAGA